MIYTSCAGLEPENLHRSRKCFYALDLYYTDPAQHPITTGWYLHEIDRDLSDPSDLS